MWFATCANSLAATHTLNALPPACLRSALQALQHEIANFGKERDKRIKAAKDKVGREAGYSCNAGWRCLRNTDQMPMQCIAHAQLGNHAILAHNSRPHPSLLQIAAAKKEAEAAKKALKVKQNALQVGREP